MVVFSYCTLSHNLNVNNNNNIKYLKKIKLNSLFNILIKKFFHFIIIKMVVAIKKKERREKEK